MCNLPSKQHRANPQHKRQSRRWSEKKIECEQILWCLKSMSNFPFAGEPQSLPSPSSSRGSSSSASTPWSWPLTWWARMSPWQTVGRWAIHYLEQKDFKHIKIHNNYPAPLRSVFIFLLPSINFAVFPAVQLISSHGIIRKLTQCIGWWNICAMFPKTKVMNSCQFPW